MSTLAGRLEDYLALRRSLGFKLDRAGRLLAHFVAYCDAAGAETVTLDLARAWATLPEGGSDYWPASRLSVVRGFARYLVLVDERTEVPPPDVLPVRTRRATPYLYTPAEVGRLMAAAANIPTPLRQATLATLVGLLYVTGMRIGEAIRLDQTDVDYRQELLVVRDSKFGESRQVAIHASTVAALRAYQKRRDNLCPQRKSPAFFVSPAGTRLLYGNVHLGFLGMVRDAGLAPARPPAGPGPTI